MHDGTFRDMAEETGLADLNEPGTGVSTGAVWGDYDNDGQKTSLSTSGAVPSSHNDGGKHFTRVTEPLVCRNGQCQHRDLALITTATANWIPFLAGYYPEDIDLWHLKTTKIMPEKPRPRRTADGKYLFHNLATDVLKRYPRN